MMRKLFTISNDIAIVNSLFISAVLFIYSCAVSEEVSYQRGMESMVEERYNWVNEGSKLVEMYNNLKLPKRV